MTLQRIKETVHWSSAMRPTKTSSRRQKRHLKDKNYTKINNMFRNSVTRCFQPFTLVNEGETINKASSKASRVSVLAG